MFLNESDCYVFTLYIYYLLSKHFSRTPNDLRLAANASEIDLILGGHDHVYEKKEVSTIT